MSTRKLLYILLIIILLPYLYCKGQSNNEVDPVQRVYKLMEIDSIRHTEVNVNNALELIDSELKILRIYKEIGYQATKDYCNTLYVLCSLYFSVNIYDNVIKYGEELDKILAMYFPDEYLVESYLYGLLGGAFFANGDFNSALNIYTKNLELCRSHRVTGEQYINIMIDLSSLYLKTNDFEKGIQIIQEAIDLCKTYNVSPLVTANAIQVYGCFYQDLGDYAEALNKFLTALEIYKEVELVQPNIIANLHGNIALIYHFFGDEERAVIYGEGAKRYYEFNSSKSVQYATSLQNLALIYSGYNGDAPDPSTRTEEELQEWINGYDKSIAIQKEANSIWEEIYGTNSMEFLNGLSALSGYYMLKGEFYPDVDNKIVEICESEASLYGCKAHQLSLLHLIGFNYIEDDNKDGFIFANKQYDLMKGGYYNDTTPIAMYDNCARMFLKAGSKRRLLIF